MTEPATATNWKNIALRSSFTGVGIAVVLALIAGVAIWYEARAKPWNSKAIVADGTPSFWVSSWISQDGKTTKPILVLQYTLDNMTGADYTIDSRSGLRLTGRFADGTLTPDFLSEGGAEGNDGRPDDIGLPVFIPAKQKALFRCHFSDEKLPSKKDDESDNDYHERLRTFLNDSYGFSGLVIFDDRNRYEIELPKWASKLPS